MEQSKEPIRLRRRTTPSGRQSLYLDIYINGKRTYEYLKLYIDPERTREDRDRNRETLQLAESIKAKRMVELRNHQFGFLDDFALDTNFFDYYKHLCTLRFKNDGSDGNWNNWWSCLKHLETYAPANTTFRDVTPAFCQGFRNYLDKEAKCRDLSKERRERGDKWEPRPLGANSKQSYWNKFKCCVNTAFEDRIIPTNPLRGIKGFPNAEVERAYLTLDEVKAMAAAPCRYPALKDAFLFSCLTGLRKCDIIKMRWREVVQQGEFTRLIFQQRKTKGQEYLDISPQAVRYMGERRGPNDLVFPGFRYSTQMLVELKKWALKAGITKDITFHSGRHTFAVIMLDLGADIYTLQKLLGHKELKTTEVYAKLMDKKKQEAVRMIPDIVPELP